MNKKHIVSTHDGRFARERIKTVTAPVYDAQDRHIGDRLTEVWIAYQRPGYCRQAIVDGLVAVLTPGAALEARCASVVSRALFRRKGKP